MEPPELREDLKQEIFVILCEMEPGKLIDLYKTNKLRFFIVRTIINQIQSSNSPFYYKYRKLKFVPLLDVDIIDHTDSHIKEEMITHCETTIENLKVESSTHWYNATILEKYIEFGSLRALSAEMSKSNVRIAFTSLAHSVNNAKAEIKRRYAV